MLKYISLLACALMLSVMLAACGGDDDPEPTVAPPTATAAPAGAGDEEEDEATATATEAEEEPTATEEVATPTTEPTEEADPTATATEEAATPTEEAISTIEPTAEGAAPTGTVEYEPDPEAEAALLDMLLEQEDVPEEYELVQVGPTDPDDNGLTFCNAEPFSRPEARLGSVEAEFDADPATGPFLLQSLTAYEEDAAIDAFAHARDITSQCEEWTDEDGMTYQLEVVEVPEYGDESYGLRMTFDVPDVGLATADFTLARFGGILMAMGFISLEGADTTEFAEITETAVDKIEAAEYRP